jgi:hypothetical protein
MAGSSVSLYGSVGIVPMGLHYKGSNLGGGLPGFIPQALITTNNSFEDFEQERFISINAWNTKYPAQLVASKRGRAVTPFRAVTNAGDLLSRKYYSCGGSCQSFQSRPGVFGLKSSFGGNSNNCDGTIVPPATCNTKYVYDSSTYSAYLKLKAATKTYNQLTYGNNNYSGSQSQYRAIKRF